MRLVGTATALGTVAGLSAGTGAAAVLVAGYGEGASLLVPLLAMAAGVVASALVGCMAGQHVARHLRRVVAELAVETDGALDGLPGLDPADAGEDPIHGHPAGARPALRPLPVRELQRLGDALVALGTRVRLADDIADRHRREADAASRGMVEMLSGLVAAEEGARGQLSAELHDTAAQSLAAARRLGAEQAEAEQGETEQNGGVPVGDRDTVTEHRGLPLLPVQPTSATARGKRPRRSDQVADLVAEAEEALRATMARARPPALRDGDLAAAVGLLRDDLEVRYGLRVDLRWPDVAFPIPLAVAVTVYRFFQEALLNVVKHADVDEACATLVVDERNVVAQVCDTGGGFRVAEQPVAGAGGRHVGLGLLRERARLAGGGVQVVSTPGDGTTLTLRLPRPAMPID